jgi:hypothetical protein
MLKTNHKVNHYNLYINHKYSIVFYDYLYINYNDLKNLFLI